MKTKIWAHRGASGDAPENSIEAFLLAREQGADGIELDVQMSLDNQLVVAHDEHLERVSDGIGSLKDYTLRNLREFNFNNGNTAYQKVMIPTLEEVYRCFGGSTMTINVELKTNKNAYPGIEARILELTSQYNLFDQVVFSSFNRNTLTRLRRLSNRCQLALLFKKIPKDVLSFTKRLNLSALHPPVALIDYWDFDKIRKQLQVDINVWTVNETAQLKKMFAAGVDAVITDYPAKAAAVRSSASL